MDEYIETRSQRHRLHWSYLTNQSWFELPYAVSTSSCDSMTAIHEVNLGSPLREIRSAGSERGTGQAAEPGEPIPPTIRWCKGSSWR